MGKALHSYARAAGRVLGRRSARNRYVRGGVAAAGTTLRASARTGRILWLQLIGALCFVFTISIAAKIVELFRNRATVEHAGAEMGFAGSLVALFGWFALSSFWKAHKLKHS
ncbi:MAG: hypothetical protein JOZ43_06340 [Acidobacteriales bacterium]|nr:hypothetical protein [Terriglobales bacterium]